MNVEITNAINGFYPKTNNWNSNKDRKQSLNNISMKKHNWNDNYRRYSDNKTFINNKDLEEYETNQSKYFNKYEQSTYYENKFDLENDNLQQKDQTESRIKSINIHLKASTSTPFYPKEINNYQKKQFSLTYPDKFLNSFTNNSGTTSRNSISSNSNKINSSNCIKFMDEVNNNHKQLLNFNLDNSYPQGMTVSKSYPNLESNINLFSQIPPNNNYYSTQSTPQYYHKYGSESSYMSNVQNYSNPSTASTSFNLGRGKNKFTYNFKNTYNKFNNESPCFLNGENTEVFSVQIKINAKETKTISFCRFDDAFAIARNFVLTNNLNELLTQPIVEKIMFAMKGISTVFNTKIDKRDNEYLNSLSILHKNLKEENKDTEKQTFFNIDNIKDADNISSISCITYIDDDIEENNNDYLFSCEDENTSSKLNKSF